MGGRKGEATFLRLETGEGFLRVHWHREQHSVAGRERGSHAMEVTRGALVRIGIAGEGHAYLPLAHRARENEVRCCCTYLLHGMP